MTSNAHLPILQAFADGGSDGWLTVPEMSARVPRRRGWLFRESHNAHMSRMYAATDALEHDGLLERRLGVNPAGRRDPLTNERLTSAFYVVTASGSTALALARKSEHVNRGGPVLD